MRDWNMSSGLAAFGLALGLWPGGGRKPNGRSSLEEEGWMGPAWKLRGSSWSDSI